MKKLLYFMLVMLMIVVLLPMFIVKGFGRDKSGPRESELEWKVKVPEKEVKIKVYRTAEKKVEEMDLEEYLKGVVAAEMPVEFELEALKAQAVAARTYACSRYKKLYLPNDNAHSEADICDDVHCQVWMSKEAAMKSWGDAAQKNWSKIETAVDETKSIIVTYEGTIINPLYHSNSGGRTENIEDVWATNEVPYLKSVFSSGEEKSATEFKNTVNIKNKEFCDKLKKAYPELKVNEKDVFKDIKILERSEGNRVKDIKVGNLTLKGVDIRNVFSLRSTNFTIEKASADTLKFTTVGYGHGVGMSQWGANFMAQSGGDYKEILKYYYKGIELKKLQDIK